MIHEVQVQCSCGSILKVTQECENSLISTPNCVIQVEPCTDCMDEYHSEMSEAEKPDEQDDWDDEDWDDEEWYGDYADEEDEDWDDDD